MVHCSARSVNWILLVFLSLFCWTAGAEIIRVLGDRIWIRLHGEAVIAGELLDVVDSNGHKKGSVEILTFNETNAVAKLTSGSVAIGMKVARNKTASPYHSNFRLNPLIVFGAVSANFDFRISRDWTLGLQAAYSKLTLGPSGIYTSDYNITAYGVGARANWFFSGAFKDSFYLGPSFEYLNVAVKTADANGPASGTASGLLVSCLLGYGWFWDAFNLMLAGGFGTVLGASGITIKDSAGYEQRISPNLSGLTYELSLGWAF